MNKKDIEYYHRLRKKMIPSTYCDSHRSCKECKIHIDGEMPWGEKETVTCSDLTWGEMIENELSKIHED